MKQPEPWATVRLRIEFPADPDTWITMVPVYEGDLLAEGINRARDMALNGFARSAYWRAEDKKKEASAK